MSELLDYMFGANWEQKEPDTCIYGPTFKDYLRIRIRTHSVRTSKEYAEAYVAYEYEQDNHINCLKDSGYGVALEHLGLLKEKEGEWAPEYIASRAGSFRSHLKMLENLFDNREKRALVDPLLSDRDEKKCRV